MKYESGDWVAYKDEFGTRHIEQVITCLEDEHLYIISGDPHIICTERELEDPPTHLKLEKGDIVL